MLQFLRLKKVNGQAKRNDDQNSQGNRRLLGVSEGRLRKIGRLSGISKSKSLLVKGLD